MCTKNTCENRILIEWKEIYNIGGSVMTPKAWGWKGGIAALVWAFRCQV
ncbi:hypothetical protein Plhal304r1_c049g0131701 [Plasmopara halstedii]